MDRFVVGFCFTADKNFVLLITKQKPEWQKGCLNGIGGKIEEDETPLNAMVREGFEEAGLLLKWVEFGVMRGTNNDGNDFECFIFYSFTDAVKRFKQKEKEFLDLYHIDDYWRHKYIANLEFIIPALLCADGCSYMDLRYGSPQPAETTNPPDVSGERGEEEEGE